MQSENNSVNGNDTATIMMTLQSISMTIHDLSERIGKVSEDGLGGTGLSGQLARTNARVDHLYSLKYMGVGILVAFGMTGAFVVNSIKNLVMSWK